MTLSPRLSDGHSEPSFSDSIGCAFVEGTPYLNGVVESIGPANTLYYNVDVHCKNVTALGKNEGKLDLTKTRQAFMYAWGPTDRHLSTTDKAAGIRRHTAYGTFWMDMTRATFAEVADAAVPSGAALLAISNAGENGGATSDSNVLGTMHAVLMCGVFTLLFPLGAVLLRLLEKVKVHGVVQSVGALAAIIGTGLGVYLSTMYNQVSYSPSLDGRGKFVLTSTPNRLRNCHLATKSSAFCSSSLSSSNSAWDSTTIADIANTNGPPYMERYIYTLVQPSF